MTTFGNNITPLGRDFFLEDSEAGFLGALSNPKNSRNIQDYFRSRPGEMLSKFNQHLSSQIVGGGLPTTNSFDFFNGTSGGFAGFGNEFLFNSPTSRGEFSGQRNPKTSFIFR